jgi:hypothetical protein
MDTTNHPGHARTGQEQDATYPFPTPDTTPSGEQAPVQILDASPGARAGDAEARRDDLREGLSERSAQGHEPAAADRQPAPERQRDADPQREAESREALLESGTRVARARRARHEGREREQMTRAVATGSTAVVAAAVMGFAAGVWWAESRRPRLRFW